MVGVSARILGTRSNWKGIAKRFVAARPEWGALLVDLRMHGDSQDFAPPHTVRAAADDVAALVSTIKEPVCGVLGHSFGAKVAIAFSEQADDSLQQMWMIDASPSAKQDDSERSAWKVVEMLKSAPKRFQARE